MKKLALCLMVFFSAGTCMGQSLYSATYKHTIALATEGTFSLLGPIVFIDTLHISDHQTASFAGVKSGFANQKEGDNGHINGVTYFALTDWKAKQFFLEKDTGSAVLEVSTRTVKKKLRKDKVGEWKCTVYSVKEMPGMEVYFSKDVPDMIRPGLISYVNKPLGGLVFIKYAQSAKTKSSTLELTDFRPIERMADLSDHNIPNLPVFNPGPAPKD